MAEYEVSGQTMQVSGVDTDTLSLNLVLMAQIKLNGHDLGTLWKKEDALQESGLIGPVQVQTTMVKTVEH